MEFLKYALVPIFVAALMPLSYSLTKKSINKQEKNMDINNFTICMSNFSHLIGFLANLIIGGCLILLNFTGDVNPYTNFILIPFLLFFLFSSYALLRMKIVINGDMIDYVPIFGKRRIYNFSDIKIVKILIKNNLTVYHVFTNKKIFVISSVYVGWNFFVQKIDQYKVKIEKFSFLDIFNR